ncbi:hypothetical protein [Tomitella fengzijianii]|uniref:Uncharacterized protein n=1 Tax=Tomitella fengzijianii TaxID=2597660 RepID=A0A516X4I2_9ACTN|nr:hypothetical protein [Tomitella fengzijianii]QDQ97989.1 hypothetical protein FO059_12515 [Tomitella fengzijianii]
MLATIRQPWFIRRALYLVVGLAALIAGATGLADPDTTAGWADQAGPWITTLVTWLAAAKTGPASDRPRKDA